MNDMKVVDISAINDFGPFWIFEIVEMELQIKKPEKMGEGLF